VEQHAGAGSGGRRQGAERKIGDAVPEKIGKALLEELVSGGDVTTVTYPAGAVKPELNRQGSLSIS
jgi:hypothetical protein